MLADERITALIEQILESDRTPEDVCADCPELLPQVQAQLRRFRAIEAQVDSLFPKTDSRPTSTYKSPVGPSHSGTNDSLPSIPDYVVQEVLGRGGMGIVFKALHLKLNRAVALKMLLNGSYAGRQEHQRFLREAEAVAALKHANIVQVYDIGEASGHPYFTMEFIDGGSLAEKLSGSPQPVRESAELLAALAHAVSAAHHAGIIHRDLKPANVLLTEDGVAKISDFGLARRLDGDVGLTNTGMRVGTPNYMAPEQMFETSTPVGPPVDIFALGAILYEMLTGRPPFRGASISDTERLLAMEEPTPPSRLNFKVPRDLETICLKCLEKEPAARYASADELAADLERFLRHEPIRARPLAPAERGLRWIRRNPLLTALAATSAVLIGLLIGDALQESTLAAGRRAEKARLTTRLESGVQLVQAGRYAEAHALLGKLGDGGFEDLRQRIDRALGELKLVEELEAISVVRATALNARDETWQPNAKAAAAYVALFDRAGIGKPTDDPASFARHIGEADIKDPLLAALDDWAVCEGDGVRRTWILQVARLANAGQNVWLNQCRDPATWNDRDNVAQLAEQAQVASASVNQLQALGDRLTAVGLDPTPFLMRVQRAHVDSFLANLSLGDALRTNNPAEAMRYYQAALAIRPQSATAHNNLAVTLANLGRNEEAIGQYERSLARDPTCAAPHFNLALELAESHPEQAIEHLQIAIELDPQLAVARQKLAQLQSTQATGSPAAEIQTP